jgi:MarR family transcriptional regulator, 2-MHQ and catechol-resistance regulon repressor
METEELIQQTIDRFWETIPATWNQIRSNIRGIITENFDITIEQFHILRHVRKGIRSVSELAEEKQISRPAISQAVDILVEKGLVTRHQSPGDRRFVQLELTESGDELLNTIFHMNRKWMAEKMSALSSEDLTKALQGMELLKQTFDPAGIKIKG